MSRTRKVIGGALGVLALGATVAPIVQAQPLPGGSVTLPPIEPIAVPVPGGSSAGQRPPLPFPLFWQEPVAPAAPRYVASNWIEDGTWCPAPNQWAYEQDGTKMWCVRLQRTDGYKWAPYTTEIPNPPGRGQENKGTSVHNSLGGKTCDRENQRAIDPSNGQEAYCGFRLLGGPVLVWMYEPGS